MKTLEEIKKFFPNHKFEDCFDLELMQFSAYDLIEFSQSYAREVAIASLEKASQKAMIKYSQDGKKDEFSKIFANSKEMFTICKSSITNEENIVL